MAVISFAHMGTVPHAVALLFEELGHRVVFPPRPSDKTFSLGTKHAPEFFCLPFKVTLGTFIEILEAGADLIVTTGGVGPCRAGHYAQLQTKVLRDLGYRFEMVVLEPPRLGILNFLGKIKRLNEAGLSWPGVYRAVRRAWSRMGALDELEKLSHRVRPREKHRGITSKVLEKAQEWIRHARSEEEIATARERGLLALNRIPQREDLVPLRVGIVGEIYLLIEPSSNLQIEEILGELGVEVHRSIFMTGWTQENAVQNKRGLSHGERIKQAAAPYLSEMIGGHGQDSVGYTVLYAQEGYDGVIQVAPFTCIPEIVARSILPRVSRDLNIPVLTFFLDEHTAPAGMRTRLEAFVDLLNRRRQQQTA